MEFKDQLNHYMGIIECSAKSLAEVSDLSPTVLSRYRNGERVPSASSEQFTKLCDGISVLAGQSGHPELTADAVSESFCRILASKKPDPRIMGSKLNLLISSLEINRADLSRFLNYDPSYLSRICSGQRSPANTEHFTREVSRYIMRRYSRESDLKITADLLGITPDDITDDETLTGYLLHWFNPRTDAE